jgi:hypothetical protein
LERNTTSRVSIAYTFIKDNVAWFSNKYQFRLRHPLHVDYGLITLSKRICLFVLRTIWFVIIFRRTIDFSLSLMITDHFETFDLICIVSLRMRFYKYLGWSLSEINNLWLNWVYILIIFHMLPRDCIFISQVIETIQCLYWLISSLFKAKD